MNSHRMNEVVNGNALTNDDFFHCDPEAIRDHIMAMRNYDLTDWENANALLQAVIEGVFDFEALAFIGGNNEEIVRGCPEIREELVEIF